VTVFESTHLVHPYTPHHGRTPLENSGTSWGVRYTLLTSTALEYCELRTEVFCKLMKCMLTCLFQK